MEQNNTPWLAIEEQAPALANINSNKHTAYLIPINNIYSKKTIYILANQKRRSGARYDIDLYTTRMDAGQGGSVGGRGG